jgi:ubiquinone/menaquinone biosynthesis C-methylase UbiE
MRLFAVLSLVLSSTYSSYIPPYYEGTPTHATVVTLDPPDFTGQEVYRIEFSLDARENMPQDGFIHRSWEDFKKLDHLLTQHLHLGLDFPSDPSVEALDSYMSRLMARSGIIKSNQLNDFLGINWSGRDLKFMESITEFMKVVVPQLYRAPDFAPEPPVFDSEADSISAEETPFEIYVYLIAFRSQTNLDEYMEFFSTFLATYPSFSAPEGTLGDTDVQPEDVSCNIPTFYNQTYVHFLPGGYLNGQTVRISYLGKSKFNFLHETKIREWLTKLHGDTNPTRILDIGTGPGFSAFVLAEMFPEAEVIAVDLSPPYIRMARKWAQMRNVTNVKFYQANAEDMSWLQSETFDLINYAYVLHEMPTENALNIVSEIYRLLRTGGTMNGFEVPFFKNEAERWGYVEFNTWGHSWEDSGHHGPEPYMEEYEFGVMLPSALSNMGFQSIEMIEYSFFESIFLAQK